MKIIGRGDIWIINFDPSIGTETQKARPAVVVQVRGLSRLSRTIVVPITSWQAHFSSNVWMFYLPPTAQNGLTKESCTDALQVKVSIIQDSKATSAHLVLRIWMK